MVKRNEIRRMEPQDAALGKIADPLFCEIVYTLTVRGSLTWRMDRWWSCLSGIQACPSEH
jgi:hypothetical protein